MMALGVRSGCVCERGRDGRVFVGGGRRDGDSSWRGVREMRACSERGQSEFERVTQHRQAESSAVRGRRRREGGTTRVDKDKSQLSRFALSLRGTGDDAAALTVTLAVCSAALAGRTTMTRRRRNFSSEDGATQQRGGNQRRASSAYACELSDTRGKAQQRKNDARDRQRRSSPPPLVAPLAHVGKGIRARRTSRRSQSPREETPAKSLSVEAGCCRQLRRLPPESDERTCAHSLSRRDPGVGGCPTTRKRRWETLELSRRLQRRRLVPPIVRISQSGHSPRALAQSIARSKCRCGVQAEGARCRGIY